MSSGMLQQGTPTPKDDNAVIANAQAAGIQFYTVGLIGDAQVDEALLQRLADETGGQYYPVTSAADLPQVFRRIADSPDPTLDSDGDGLPDWLETQGIRRGNGSIVATNPAEADTDGDGLDNGVEVGTRRTGPDGDYYDGITDPTKADTDGDGIGDRDEVYGITNPVNADTDGDGLADGIELDSDFDPTNANPDGDSFGDAAELTNDTDPFTYDLAGGEYVLAFAAGFGFGEAGQNMVNLGLLNSAYLQSFAYLGGWLASGSLLLGDIRDAVVALANGDLTGTLLNAIALIPALGDGLKVIPVVNKYVGWVDHLRAPLARWLQKQFAEAPTIERLIPRMLGYTNEAFEQFIKQCVYNSFSADTLVTNRTRSAPDQRN